MSAYDVLDARGVTRLCHFTKLQGLTHILSSVEGILASSSIRADIKNVTDNQRYDGELEYICCSIEYPNSWFLDKAIQRNTDQIFKDWVTLYIDLTVLKTRESKYCSCNAAKDWGRYIFDDESHVDTLFASPALLGWQRTPQMLNCCPTNDQAEILIKHSIPRNFIIGIVAGNEEIAESISSILTTYKMIYGVPTIPIYISQDIMSTNWSSMVRNGERPIERKFDS